MGSFNPVKQVLIPAVAVTLLGTAIGVVDAFVLRPLAVRSSPVDVDTLLRARSDAGPPGGQTPQDNADPADRADDQGERFVFPDPDPREAGPESSPATEPAAQEPPTDTTRAFEDTADVPDPADAETPRNKPNNDEGFTFTDAASMPEGHITIEQAYGLYEMGAQFVDARRLDEYQSGHVANAFRIALADFDAGRPVNLDFMQSMMPDLSSPVVVYCGGGDCDESKQVARMLNSFGFPNVYVMHDGYPGWVAAGHPAGNDAPYP